MDELDKLYYGFLTDPALLAYWNSDFFNMGLWSASTHNQREACENLLEHLFERVERPVQSALDVACGLGGIVDSIHRRFAPDELIGINFSEFQIGLCKQKYPAYTFLKMDADAMTFEPNRFDLITCIEAALHFKNRKAFLKKCFELLRPGGILLMTDILAEPDIAHQGDGVILSRDEYETICEKTGYERIVATSNKPQCWDSFVENLRIQANALNDQNLLSFYEGCMQYPVTDHIILSAVKPR